MLERMVGRGGRGGPTGGPRRQLSQLKKNGWWPRQVHIDGFSPLPIIGIDIDIDIEALSRLSCYTGSRACHEHVFRTLMVLPAM